METKIVKDGSAIESLLSTLHQITVCPIFPKGAFTFDFSDI